MSIDTEMLENMIRAMDKDGDGQCTKAEFKEAYCKFKKEAGATVSDADFEGVWAKIDADKSGDVSIAELASHYGYKVGKDGHLVRKADGEMDDDDILEALKMAASLEVAPKPVEVAKPVPEKIERVKSINMKSAAEGNLERQLLEESALGDVKRVAALIEKIQEAKGTIRVEDSEMGQMPLHKLARVGDKSLAVIKTILEVGGEPKKDINYQDNNGKTPLHLAAELGQAEFVELLLNRGSDPTIVSKTGWSCLHSGVHSQKQAVVKKMLENDRVRPKKSELVKISDTQGRTALHIAAFRGEDEAMVKLLLEHGADAKQSDTSGNNASALAGKAGRRKSRELLEAFN